MNHTHRDHDSRGRFAKGNQAASGRRSAGEAARQARAALLDAATPEAVGRVVSKMLELAEAGDVPAAKLVLAYSIGPPRDEDVQSRLDELDRLMREIEAMHQNGTCQRWAS